MPADPIQFIFAVDYFMMREFESLCYRFRERPRNVKEQAIVEAIDEFDIRMEMPENGYKKTWGFRQTSIPTDHPKLLRAGQQFFGHFQKLAFDVAINRYLWEKVIERRHRLLRQPPSH